MILSHLQLNPNVIGSHGLLYELVVSAAACLTFIEIAQNRKITITAS